MSGTNPGEPLTAHGPPLTVVIAGGGTGGHLMPALAIANAVRRDHPDWRVVLAGANRGLEATLLPTRDFPFHLFPAEPLYRRQWWKNFKWPFLAFGLIREVDRMLEAERPAVVVGTGGYASGPVVWRAARRGIPTAIQEQNAFPGFASRRLAGRVREIWLGVPEARAHLSPGRQTQVLDLGNPIPPPDPARRDAALRRFGLDATRPILLVTGGSQGSLALNEAVAGWISAGGAEGIQVLWVTGRGTYRQFQAAHRAPHVHVIDFLDPMGDGYAVADLAVSRAGMMTVAELSAWGIPSILIPLPTAAGDHQTPNARVMADAGAAVHLPQRELSAAHLGEILRGILANPAGRRQMAAAALGRGRPDAARQISERIGVLSG